MKIHTDKIAINDLHRLESLGKNEEVMGSYSPIASAWSPTTLLGAIETIIDFRTDTKEE